MQSGVDETLHFYIHPTFWPQVDVPESADTPWSGFDFGIYIWTVQTFLRLRDAGIRCDLVPELPERGIVIAHRESLQAIDGKFAGSVLPTAHRFVVDMCADLAPFPPANMHVVQNRTMQRFGPNYLFVRHWPQPRIIPRDPARGDLFRNIAYVGNRKNLAISSTAEWEADLASRGLAWNAPARQFELDDPGTFAMSGNWNDYHDVDAVIAIRTFGAASVHGHDRKPASKLFNAWLAGVPAIVGVESCYRDERRSELDFLEAASYEQLLACIDVLRTDPERRAAMVENGCRRAVDVTSEATLAAWIALVHDEIVPAYREWTTMTAAARRATTALRAAHYYAVRIRGALARRLGR